MNTRERILKFLTNIFKLPKRSVLKQINTGERILKVHQINYLTTYKCRGGTNNESKAVRWRRAG